MNENISDKVRQICFQLREFFRINHRFGELVSPNTKSFVSDLTQGSLSPPAREQTRRTRSGKSKEITPQQAWPHDWAIDKTEFEKP
jgi:hypothetical protein